MDEIGRTEPIKKGNKRKITDVYDEISDLSEIKKNKRKNRE